MERELLNCPFCDSKAYMKSVPNTIDGHPYVYCDNDFCRVELEHSDTNKCIEKWNTRAPNLQQASRIKELEEALEYYANTDNTDMRGRYAKYDAYYDNGRVAQKALGEADV